MGKKKEVTLGLIEKKSKKGKKEQKVMDEAKEIKTAVKAKDPKSSKANKGIKIRGKKYLKAKKGLDAQKLYSLSEAIKLLKSIAYEAFDASVELHANLLESNLKGEANLPHGTGKTVRIAIFDPELEEKIKSNKLDFDILLAQPKDMPKLVKYAKILGPKGLMPSPKRGTLTDDLDAAKKKLSSGVLQYKSEAKFPLLHQIVGKKSFSETQLKENIVVLVNAVAKKNIQTLFIKTSMSPVIRVDLDSI